MKRPKRRKYLGVRYLALYVLLVLITPVLLVAKDLLKPLPEPTTTQQRLAMFPTQGLHVRKPVTIYWNAHQTPYVEAQTDDDAAYALGMIHAHLRLGQMELARRLVYGRLSEIAGPVANSVDATLRVLNYPKSAHAVYEAAPLETKRWMERFTDGINDYMAQMKDEPHEFRVFALKREPWKPEDLYAVGRLAGTDYSWLIWFTLLQYRDSPKWETIWNVMLDAGSGRIYSKDRIRENIIHELNRQSLEKHDADQLHVLLDMIWSSSELGSNSVVVAPSRSLTGASMIASDPHLGLTLPNLWFVVGLKSPSYNVVGMMAPTLPVFAFGRNRDIAWGGTNLHAANSDLYDITGVDKKLLTHHTEMIKNRFWFPTRITYRTSPWGPVISDAPLIPKVGKKTVALKWVGHGMSDEITAMLRVNHAHNWREFSAAYETYAIPALNMLYADRDGNIGRLSATQVPHRTEKTPRDIFSSLANYNTAWDRVVHADGLPSEFIPHEGFLVSANNPTPEGTVAVGYFFAPPDRAQRLADIIRYWGKMDVERLKQMQRDVFSSSSLIVRDALLERMKTLDVGESVATQTMRAWDGYYYADSRGALAYQAFIACFARALYKALDGEDELKALSASAYFDDFLLNKTGDADEKTLRKVYVTALREADTLLRRYDSWGDAHRLEVKHVMANIPVIGDRYVFDDLPTPGSRETVMKQAHGLIDDEPHGAFYGAQSRHISDMGDNNANYFSLLGGQDGWLNSENFLDQVEMWRKGEYIQVPLDVEVVRKTFPYKTVLLPQKKTRESSGF